MAASVTVDSGPISASDRLRDVPKEKWHDLMLARKQFMEISLTYDCRCLLEFVSDAQLMYESLGFSDVETMIREGYNLVPEEIDIAVAWLRLNPTDDPVPIEVPLRKQGRPSKGEEKHGQSIIKSQTKAHWLARLKRDHPEIRSAYDRGEFKSARAAALVAGIIKVKPPLDQLRSWWKKATQQEQQTFKEEIK